MKTATKFNHETIVLDGEAFSACEFRDCRLVFQGGEPPTFEDCTFDDCDWRFEAAAANTLAHLKTVWAAGGKAQIQALIKTITGAARETG
jgi:hypothetical protein